MILCVGVYIYPVIYYGTIQVLSDNFIKELSAKRE